jgi:acid phosphatase family membrane protein YuiD
MKSSFEALASNRPLLSAGAAWFTAQVLKLIIFSVLERRLHWRKLLETGGLPSAHSALVVGLCIGVALTEGFHSTMFAVTAVFALIVMYDAMNLRAEAGKHADLLNELLLLSVIKDAYREREKLKELLGHTPFEVAAGAIIGVMTAVVVNVQYP